MEMPTRGSFVYDASSPSTFFVQDDPANTVPVVWDHEEIMTSGVKAAESYYRRCTQADTPPKPNVYAEAGNTVGETIIYVLRSMNSTP